MDSRTILDASGAEKLLGNGDMLFSSAAAQGLRRLQGVYVSESEVKHVVSFIKKQEKIRLKRGSQMTLSVVKTTGVTGRKNTEHGRTHRF